MIRSPKNLIAAAIVGMVLLISMMATPSAVKEAEYRQAVIAGGPEKFVEVRHVSEGLAVAILAEEESVNKVGREPGDEVGLHELMGMRYLLDNCKNVEEAKETLLSLKHYYSFIPCHYIIGDRSGKYFIFEFSPSRNRSYIIDGGDLSVSPTIWFFTIRKWRNSRNPASIGA